jgi:hypothetical protein
MSFSKLILLSVFIGVVIANSPYSLSQIGPPDGEGFILTLANSRINSLQDLNRYGCRICGDSRSFEAFRSHTGYNVRNVRMHYSEGFVAMERGLCDAVVAYSTDRGIIRELYYKWREYPSVRVFYFP